MITRKEYMKDSSNLFHEYHSQFITQLTINFINREIGIEKLLTSKCEHLNDLYKHSHGGSGSWIWDYAPINEKLVREAGDNLSPSTYTCVAKACARNLINEYKNTLSYD